ncbi:MAG: hypothetical protein J7M26_09810, partial [Armatimonadetes bacterium]|nr:hypothetical protein [Armatimonadota bacterium]
ADRARRWQVDWSSDGKQWHKLFAGASDLAWHEARVPATKSQRLYLHCHGDGMQVAEVVVCY